MALIITDNFSNADLLVAVRFIRIFIIYPKKMSRAFAEMGSISFLGYQISCKRMKGVVAKL